MIRFKLLLFSILSFFYVSSKAQSGIVTDITAPYDDVEYLIQNVLSDGTAQISNITYTFGSPEQIGYFQDTDVTSPYFPIFQYEDGMFMATKGNTCLEGNNIGGSFPPGVFGPSPVQDPDVDLSIQQLFGANYNAGHDQNNLIIIEFDIVANLDYFEFIYSFASREYISYTCSGSFNDVFGFYVSGPNPNNPAAPYVNKNIALVPTDLTQTSFTNTPVSINSINYGSPTGGGSHQTCLNANPNYQTDSMFFIKNYSPKNIQFDYTGYTKPLKAFVEAECNETYHMKLAICDVSDQGWGSAVLLKKGSLRSPVDVTFEPAPNVYPDTNGWFYEGCGTSTITFKRPSAADFAPGTGDLVVDFTLLGTAQYGVDYDFLNNPYSDKLIIPNLDNEFTLEINPIDDGILEGPENLIIRIPHLAGQSCNSDYVELEITIQDYPELTLTLVDELDTHCPGDEVTFEVSVSGGLPINSTDPYNVHWSQIGYAYEQTVSPEVSTTYYVEVVDLCPQYEHVDSIRINVSVWPELVIDELEDQYICDNIANNYGFLNNKVHGGDGVFTYSWYSLDEKAEVSTDEDPLLFPGTYEVTIRDGCENQASAEVTIFHYEVPDADILAEEQATERTVELSIDEFPVSINVPFMPLTYTWDFGDGSPVVVNKGPLVHQYPEFGFYTVTLTIANDRGCEKVFTKTLEVSPFINIPTIFTPNGDGINEGFAPVSSRQYSSYEIEIFDRWGKEVFEANDIETKWYGKTKDGLVCGEGIYVYKIKIKYPNYPETKEHQGVINLSR